MLAFVCQHGAVGVGASGRSVICLCKWSTDGPQSARRRLTAGGLTKARSRARRRRARGPLRHQLFVFKHAARAHCQVLGRSNWCVEERLVGSWYHKYRWLDMASIILKDSDGDQNIVLNTKAAKESGTINLSQNNTLDDAEDLPVPSNGNDKVCSKKPDSYLNQRMTHTRKVKLKRKSTLDSLGIKRKLENEEKCINKKDPKIVEHQNPPLVHSLSRVPLKSVMDVEMKLVYVDEQQIMYEFIESLESRSAQSACEVTKSGESVSSCALNLAPQMDKWLAKALKDASFYYHQKKYSVAAGRFKTALELCSKGAVLGDPFYASYEKISSIASFIETKLVTCYLRMRRPDLALNHAHRSIFLNPINFRNHLRQATVFRCLERYTEAARSAMIADYIYWLHGAKEQNISKHVKLYWQAMLEEGITQAETFSVMYTPVAVKPTVVQIEKIKEVFRNKHPSYASYLYADPSTNHILPQTVDWSDAFTQHYMLLLGFKNPEDGNFLEKIISRRSPTFTESRTPFWSLTVKEVEKNMDILGRRILPVLDFTLCTKLAGGICPGVGVLEKLQYASYLSQLKRMKEQAQVINQTIAELATMPYLREMSQHEVELLHSLMTDAVDTLEGNKTSGECVWSKTEKVGLIEELIYQLEDNFLKAKALKTARKQRKVKKLKIQNVVPLPGEMNQCRETKSMGKTTVQSSMER